jgi:hypothetical protein
VDQAATARRSPADAADLGGQRVPPGDAQGEATPEPVHRRELRLRLLRAMQRHDVAIETALAS